MPYSEFAEAFSAGKAADLRSALEKHAGAFTLDHNFGLAKQCLSALMHRCIRTLTETYLTLSLPHIADKARAIASIANHVPLSEPPTPITIFLLRNNVSRLRNNV